MTDFRPVLAALVGALMAAGCSGDNAVRSPDLPPPQLAAIGLLTCDDTLLAVGQSANCTIAQCAYVGVDENGNEVPSTGACPPLQFDSTAPSIARFEPTAQVFGVAPGSAQISVVAEGIRSNTVAITVTAACVEDFRVTPAGTSIVAGTSQPFTSTLTFSDGETEDVTQETAFTVTNPGADPDAVTLTANVARSNADIMANTTVVITGSYTGPAAACPDATLSNQTALTVIPASVLTIGGVCVETVPPATAFAPGAANCRPDSGACVTEPLVFGLADNSQRQLQIRARYNNDTECNVTADASIATNPGGIIAVDDNALATAVAEGSTTISASFRGQTGNRAAQVRVDQVFGKNSLAVSARELVGGEAFTFSSAQRFACVGANDLVAGLGGGQLRGQLLAYARTRTCGDNELSTDGNCTALVFDDEGNLVVDPDTQEQLRSAEAFNALPLQNDVTNPMPLPGQAADNTIWSAQAGFWNGEACETTGSGGDELNSPANVGDAFAAVRELQLDSGNIPVDDPSVQPNGLVYADGAVRLGFTCVTASTANPLDPTNVATDGMTVLILPIANDALLGASEEADRLCATLLPAFSNPLLGALEGTPLQALGRIELINTLSAITEIVNPALEGLDQLPLDQILTTLLEGNGDIPGLTDLTALIVQPLDEGLVSPVLEPLVCQVTNGLNLLLGLLSGGSGNQECPALVP